MVYNYKEKGLQDAKHIKTFMMLLIVLYHSMALWLPEGWFNQSPAQNNVVFTYASQWLNLLHIYVFTFVSGYVYSYLRIEKKKYYSFNNLLNKKFKRLLLPYIAASIFWCIPFYYVFFRPSVGQIANNYLLAYAPSQLWYILMLFILFLVMYPFTKFINSLNDFSVCLICVGIYSMYILINYFFVLPFQVNAVIKHIPFFILGMLFRKRDRCSGKWYVYLFINILLFIMIVEISESGLITKLLKKYIEFLTIISGILFVVNLFATLPKNSLRERRIYKVFEDNSFRVYFFHQQIIWVVISLLNGMVCSWILVLISFISSIMVSIMISKILSIIYESFNLT